MKYTLPSQVHEDYIGRHLTLLPLLPVYAWYCNERERIRIRREVQNLPKPWTEDPIYQEFRFTNIHREDDRVSRELRRAIQTNRAPELQLFNAVVFRTFNSQTGYIAATGGWCHNFNPLDMLKRLDRAVLVERQSVWGNAYLMVNSMTAGAPKHHMYVNGPFREIWKDRKDILWFIQDNPSLGAATRRFTHYTGYAEFLGYELALDMEMIGLYNPVDKYTWANPGPGARRGLNYVFGRDRKYRQSTSKFLDEMKLLFDESIHFLHPHVKHWDMRCIENALCETSKYASVLQTGRAKRRYK